MKRSKSLLALILAVVLLISAAPAAVAAESETLTIRGDGVDNEITFSRDDLEGLKDMIKQHEYSFANNFPTDKTEYAQGVPLLYLLEQAGLRDTARLITFIASDGYQRQFTIQELLETPRYYFSDAGEKTSVPVLICLQSGEGAESLEPSELKLIMGQRARGEQTNPWIVKKLSVIEVSCEQPEEWSQVIFNKVSGADGLTLEMRHERFDSVKIYYTTDGSDPTPESNMYNVSASYYQPELNKPLLITKTTTVRAVAIGPGKTNSAIASVTVNPNDTVFNDLEGFDWARAAIEALSVEGIVNGVGDSRFNPAGDLTRAMFVTMLGRALNKDGTVVPPAPCSGFPDVDYNSWYGSHVRWAVNEGVVSGYTDGTFKPSNSLTVEEMIVMAVRAAGMDTENIDSGKSRLIDQSISAWAKPYIIAAELGGLLETGHMAVETDGGILVEGQTKASRAEAAVIIYSLLP